MLTIKLSRFGKKKQPTYRVLVMEKTKDPWGDYLEMLGHYDPRTKKAELNVERIKHWISKGAALTDSINNLLITNKIIEGKKRGVTRLSNKRREKMAKEQPKKAAEISKPVEGKTAETPKPAEEQAAPAETPAPNA